MKNFAALLLLPFWTASAWISGTVVDLAGKPVQGAVVASSSESDVSKPSGGWILGRTAGIRRMAADLQGPTSNLSIHNGRLVVSWNGRDPKGRRIPSTLASFSGSGLAGARVAGSRGDTLQVYFKGRRLVWLPLTTSDTDGVEIQIDTGWGDDYGIAWNARVHYGSLRDERDGKVYRTVRIGSHTWMAENLNYSGPVAYGGRISRWRAEATRYAGSLDLNGRLHNYGSIGTCQGPSDSLCAIYGRLYSWYEGIGDTNPKPNKSFLPVRGACPEGWRVPNDSDWLGLAAFTGADTADHDYLPGSSPLIPLAIPEDRQVEFDSLGFRPLAGGNGFYRYENTSDFGGVYLYPPPSPMPDSIIRRRELGSLASFWSANFPQSAGPGRNDAGYQVQLTASHTREDPSGANWGINHLSSLRCLKDLPLP